MDKGPSAELGRLIIELHGDALEVLIDEVRMRRRRSCGAPILWARTPVGRPIPLDPEPAVDGNVFREGESVGYGVVLKTSRRPTTRATSR